MDAIEPETAEGGKRNAGEARGEPEPPEGAAMASRESRESCERGRILDGCQNGHPWPSSHTATPAFWTGGELHRKRSLEANCLSKISSFRLVEIEYDRHEVM